MVIFKNSGFIQYSSKALWFAFLLLLIQLILFKPALAKKPVSVGVVNVTFLMENAPQSEIASNKLKTKFLPQEKKLASELEEISSLEKELSDIKSNNSDLALQRQKEREIRSRKRIRSRSLQDFREELRFARDEALDNVQKEVFRAIDQVRIQQEIDIILQDYVSASSNVDITPLVLDFLKEKLEAPQDNTDKGQLLKK